jgi:ribonuclease BN (tRNA processing enzyme)
MKVVFLGVGEAFDETLPNNSHLVISETKILLDCGYNAPAQIWKYSPNPSLLDAVFISHTHADHYFGIPALLTRMWEEKRTKPLTMVCPAGTGKTIQELIEYGYRGISERFDFRIDFREGDEHHSVKLNELVLSFAPTEHPADNHAVRISDGKHTLCYSGDGMFTDQTAELYRNSDLVIHEAYTFDTKIPNHACIADLILMAKRNNIKCLALTHLQRDFRKKRPEELKKQLLDKKLEIIIPEPFEEYSFRTPGS